MATCAQLRTKLAELKDLKMEFDLELRNVRKSRNVNTLKKIRENINKSLLVFKEMLDPYADWRKYENGELVCHYEGSFSSFIPNAKGIVIMNGNKFLLNGVQILFEGRCERYWTHPNGVVIRNGDQLLLNGRDLIYKGPYDSVVNHPKGVVINLGQHKFLNGRKMISTRSWDKFNLQQDRYIKLWGDHRHPDGVLIERDNKFTLVDMNRSEKLLYEGEFDDWAPYHDGIIIRKGADWFFYNQPIEEKEK
jgi:hypothetical protein